jgi:hypothetical protein
MTNAMIQTIEQVGKALNEAGVRWAVGGSVLLQANGFPVEPNDLDVIFEKNDAEKAVRLLESVGARRASDPSYHYQSYSFTELMVGSVEVDLMAGLTVIKDRVHYEYPFDASTPLDLRVVGSVTVPFMTLEDWLVLYDLMPGKAWKAQLISDHFRKNGSLHPGRSAVLLGQMAITGERAEEIRKML